MVFHALRLGQSALKIYVRWAVVVVKWSACLPSTPTIRVQIPLKSTVFTVKFVFEMNENKQKEAGGGQLTKIYVLPRFILVTQIILVDLHFNCIWYLSKLCKSFCKYSSEQDGVVPK